MVKYQQNERRYIDILNIQKYMESHFLQYYCKYVCITNKRRQIVTIFPYIFQLTILLNIDYNFRLVLEIQILVFH